jgi:hypothetical protein
MQMLANTQWKLSQIWLKGFLLREKILFKAVFVFVRFGYIYLSNRRWIFLSEDWIQKIWGAPGSAWGGEALPYARSGVYL